MSYDDDRCDLDPNKICDNCFRCLEPDNQQDYAKIEISAVYTDEDYFVEDAAGDYSESRRSRIHVHTLIGCCGTRKSFRSSPHAT